MQAKKSLGQHFLISAGAVRTIIQTALLPPEDTVLEVGPGTGTLSQSLLAATSRVIAVEKDDRLIPILQEKFADSISAGKLILLHDDILNLELSKLEKNSYKVVANIPYYLTGKLLSRFLTADS